MSYKELKLRAKSTETAATEIMYEIAAARVDNIDLIRFDIFYDNETENDSECKKVFSSVIKLLKNMKRKGSIQFFATADSFRLSTTEAVFLQNKYPEMFLSSPKSNGGAYVYIKI